MARKLKETVSEQDAQLTEFIKWVEQAEEATVDARESSEKCRDYYDSKQLTDEEVAALKKRKQPVIVNNRIAPKVNALMGMEKQSRTSPKAYPRTPKHEADADAATEAIRYVLDKNSFDAIRSPVFENICIEGTGGGEVIVKENSKGTFDVVVKQIMWDRLFFDPKSRAKNYSDARYLGQIVWMDWRDAEDKFPDRKQYLDAARDESNGASQTYSDKPVSWVSSDRKRVRIVEMSYKRGGKVYDCTFTKSGFLIDPKESPFVDEEGNQEWRYEFQSAYVTRDNERYGEVKRLLDLQDEVNKRRSKALHLMNVRQTFGNKGAVSDVQKFRNEAAKPDGHLEGDVGEWNKDFGVVPTGDMAAAQFQMLQEAKAELDATSVNAALTGAESRDLSGKALKQLTQGSQLEVAPLFDCLRDWQLRIYRKIWNRIRQYWTEEMWIRVTDDEENIKWVGLNRPITLGEKMQQEGQQIPPEMMNDPRLQEVVGKAGDVATLDVDIILDEMPDMVSQQQEQFETLVDLAGKAANMPPPMFLALVKASSMRNKDALIKSLNGESDIPPEVQQQMQDAKAQVEELTAALQQTQAEHQEMMMSKESEAQKLAAEQQKMQVDVATKQMDAQLEREKMALEREKIMLEREKMSMQSAELKIKRGEEGYEPIDPLEAVTPLIQAQNEQMSAFMMQMSEAISQLVMLNGQVLMAVSDKSDMAALIELQRQTLAVVSAPKTVDIVRTRNGFSAVAVPETIQ